MPNLVPDPEFNDPLLWTTANWSARGSLYWYHGSYIVWSSLNGGASGGSLLWLLRRYGDVPSPSCQIDSKAQIPAQDAISWSYRYMVRWSDLPAGTVMRAFANYGAGFDYQLDEVPVDVPTLGWVSRSGVIAPPLEDTQLIRFRLVPTPPPRCPAYDCRRLPQYEETAIHLDSVELIY